MKTILLTLDNLSKRTKILVFLVLSFTNSYAQEKPIFLQNPSFEGEANSSAYVQDWTSCQMKNVPRNVNNPALLPGAFGVDLFPIDGATYLGLVVRDNNTWESLSQELTMPLSPDWCYLFQLALAQADNFVNFSALQQKQTLFNTPIVLKIWGGNTACSKTELLSETVAIDHFEWDSYTFYLCPTERHTHLTLEAYYADDQAMTIPNGHVLIDDASPLYPLPYSYGEIDWDKVPKSDYLAVEDIDQFNTLITDYGSQISFEASVLPYQIYLDAYSGLRYGNIYLETIISALNNFSDEVLLIAVLPDAKGNTKQRISELKNTFKDAGIQAYQYKIKAADKLSDETDWLTENAFLKMKLL